ARGRSAGPPQGRPELHRRNPHGADPGTPASPLPGPEMTPHNMKYTIRKILPRKVGAWLSRSIYVYEVFTYMLGIGKHQRRVTCTLCGNTRTFYAVGHPPRYNAMCPVCNSLERHRLIALLNDREKLFTNKSV